MLLPHLRGPRGPPEAVFCSCALKGVGMSQRRILNYPFRGSWGWARIRKKVGQRTDPV